MNDLFKPLTRTERQKECIKSWIKSKGCGTVVCPTGFGKTRIGTTLTEKMCIKRPDLKVIVVVPTTALKEQWEKIIDSLGLSLNCNVEVINTIIKQNWQCDLLIMDECHRYAANTFGEIFNKVTYTYVLGLTATFERLDGKHEILKKYCPVIDEVTLLEALTNGWVAAYKEYIVLLKVDDINKYEVANKEFNEHFEFFMYDFGKAMSCIGRNGYINQLKLRDELCPNGTKDEKSQVLKTIKYHSARFMATMQARKSFINNHPKKIEIARQIINARQNSKIITFSNNIKMAESIGYGKVYSGRDSKKKGRITLEEFSNSPNGVLNSIAKLNEGLDCPGLSVAIILGTDSSKIKAKQRLGRVIRVEDFKQAEIFNLVIDNTIETKWVNNSHDTMNVITIDESGLIDVLCGREPKPYKKPIKNFTFRF